MRPDVPLPTGAWAPVTHRVHGCARGARETKVLHVVPRLLRETVMMRDMTELTVIWFTTLAVVAGIMTLSH